MNIKEELRKSDVDGSIKTYMNSSDFKEKVEKIVKDRIKNEKELENKVVEITKNVLSQLYKTLWIKRNTWLNGLNNNKS